MLIILIGALLLVWGQPGLYIELVISPNTEYVRLFEKKKKELSSKTKKKIEADLKKNDHNLNI